MMSTTSENTVPFKELTFTTFHPDWETIEKRFWSKRVLLLVGFGAFVGIFIWIGLYWPNSVMISAFAKDFPYHFIEFCLWLVAIPFLGEIGFIALHKIGTTRIKYEMSKNEEMRVSIQFNRAFFALFVLFFCFNILKLAIRFIFGYYFWDSNIWRAITDGVPLGGWLLSALYVLLGFTGFAEFLFYFERVVMARKHPVLWVIPVIGMALMILGPWDAVLFELHFTSTLIASVTVYYFGQWMAVVGGIFVPILYFVMGSRFSYGHPQTSQDCYRKGIGFVVTAVAAVFDVNQELYFSSVGGLPFYLEAFTWTILAPLLTIIGVLLVRSAYRPKG